MIRETDFMKKHKTNYNKIVRNLTSLFYKSFIWVGYAFIAIILSWKEFSLLNMSQMLLLFLIFSIHLQRSRNHPEAAHQAIYYVWNFFILLNTVVLATKYLYSFTT